MWLSSSSVGRKFVMAVSGAALLLFVTFHCLLNAIAICWPATYNSVCEFLGANWYALLASVVLAALIVVHIIYACVLTMQNRRARGHERYQISKRPKTVEWSSKNMLVLGIVILAFLVVHLIQFWAKMQLAEIRGAEEMLPPSAGTLFIQEAFGNNWTWIVYIIGFIALWFHLNHGFWSMFQSIGWDSTIWIPRLKKIGCWWVTIVCLCFTAQAIVFTVKAHDGYYKTNPELRNQYLTMLPSMYERDFGPDADTSPALMQEKMQGAQILQAIKMGGYPYSMIVEQGIRPMLRQAQFYPQDINDPQVQEDLKNLPPEQKEEAEKVIKERIRMAKAWREMNALIDYLEGVEPQPEQPEMQGMPQQNNQPRR